MKRLSISVLAAVLLISSGTAGTSEFSFSGAGGPMLAFTTMDMGFINDRLALVTHGYKEMDGPVVLWGGFGYGEVADRFKFGGFGFGGANEETGTFLHQGTRVRQDVSLSLGGGGLYTEYEAVHVARRLEGSLCMGIGFGGASLRIDQFGSNVQWNDLWNSLNPDSIASRNTFAIAMSRAFFMLVPEVGVKFFITRFMALEGRVGYMLTLNLSDWEYKDMKVLDAPDTDFSAPTFGLRLIFGG